MRYNINRYVYFGLIILLSQSCAAPMYPGLRTNPLGPRMIQPPMLMSRNGNQLPNSPNFVHSYSNYKKSKTNSKFGALVRIIEFEYDIADTLSIIPRITSGFDEGEMTGIFTIIVDQYELTYEDSSPQIREYVEEVSYESPESAPRNQNYNYQISPRAIHNSLDKKQEKVINRSQLYNSAKYNLEREDALLIQRSKTLYYIIHMQNCELIIYPTKEQIKVLKTMILKYY